MLAPILSVVVPLENVQADLYGELDRLLECAADLTPGFELLLVHKDALDQAPDAIDELSRSYPQLRLIRNSGTSAAGSDKAGGVQQARGQVVIVVEPGARFSPARLRQLWNLRNDEQLIMARAEPAAELNPGWLNKLLQWGEQLRQGSAEGGLQMIRRNTLEPLKPSQEDIEQLVLEYRLDPAHPSTPVARRGGFLQHLRDLAIG